MSRIFVCGDIHGSATSFIARINFDIKDPKEDDVIICTGDVGLEYGDHTQNALKEAMKDFPGKIYIMRGNHDNRYWTLHTIQTETVEGNFSFSQIIPTEGWNFKKDSGRTLLYEEKYPNILYIRDCGGIYHINGYDFLFIPGAYSIDKKYRLYHNLPYEPQEQLSWQEKSWLIQDLDYHLSKNNKINYIISHTGPSTMQDYYQDLFFDFIDQNSVDNSMECFLDTIYHMVKDNKFDRWYFGHYHDDRKFDKFTMVYRYLVEVGE